MTLALDLQGSGADTSIMKTIQIPAKDLLIDDIVVDEDGTTHEVISIDLPPAPYTCMGVWMHGEEDGGEFCYRVDEPLTVWARAFRS